MEKEQIAIHVEESGKKAQYHADSTGPGYHTELIASWIQAKMLAEIAYQLAVMNERNALEDERLGDRVEGISISVTALESRVDKLDGQIPDTVGVENCHAVNPKRGYLRCNLLIGHKGNHGWDVQPQAQGVVLCLRPDPEEPTKLCGKAEGHPGNCGWRFWNPLPNEVIQTNIRRPAYVEYDQAKGIPTRGVDGVFRYPSGEVIG